MIPTQIIILHDITVVNDTNENKNTYDNEWKDHLRQQHKAKKEVK